MKKLASLFVIVSVVCILLFSCGGGGGGVDEAIDETFTVSYDANGAESGAVPAAQKGSEKSPIIISDNTGNLHKNGYVFCGWRSPSLDLFNPGTSYNGKNNANYSNDKKKLTLYAAWEPLFNYNVINPGNPAPSLNGMQKSPSISYAEITGLTVRGLALSNIEIPWSMDGYQISSIHSQAFYNNANIQSISIPESVTSIGFLAFYGCSSIASITIPSSVTNIGHEAFSHCSNLSNLILLSSTPPVMGEYALAECPVTVSVPLAGVDTYKAAGGWDSYSGQIVGYRNETFTVTFDGQGATTAANPATKAVVPPEVSVGQLPSPPARTGYIFGGWYTEPEGAGEMFTANTEVAANMTVFAKWNTYSYTVTFNGQGADSEPVPPSISVNSPNINVGSLPAPLSKGGFYFGGWNTKSDGTGTAFTASTTVTGNITVYAIWMENPAFTVTFDSQGASNYVTKQIKVVSPATTTGNLPTAPIKKGFTFNGWYTGREGTGEKFTASTVVTGNITVYASWTALIRYEVNGLNAAITGLTTEGRALSQIQIPETIDTYTVTAIGSYAFEDCTNITSISLPDTITNIGEYAFYRCSNLATINLPNGLPNVGNRTFYQCTKLTSITLPESITAIREAAFYQSGLTSIRIPASVISVGEDAFTGCNSLTNVTVSSYAAQNFRTIFTYCTNIQYITVFGSAPSIDINFASPLKSITVSSDNTNYSSKDGILYNKAQTSIIGIPGDLSGDITIANGISRIEENAFLGRTGITSIIIPNNVTSIGVAAFKDCSGLASITIPSGITNIGEDTFNGCGSLTAITLPNGVTSIGQSAFCRSGLTSITIPSGVTSIKDETFKNCIKLSNITIPDEVTYIGTKAFSESGLTSITIGEKVNRIHYGAFSFCYRLETLILKGNPPELDKFPVSVFSSCDKLSTIKVPAESVAAYKAADGWSEYKTLIVADE